MRELLIRGTDYGWPGIPDHVLWRRGPDRMSLDQPFEQFVNRPGAPVSGTTPVLRQSPEVRDEVLNFPPEGLPLHKRT